MGRDIPLIHFRTDYFAVLLHYWLQCSQLSLIVCVLNKITVQNLNVGMKIHALQQNFCAEALDKGFYFLFLIFSLLVPRIVSGVLWVIWEFSKASPSILSRKVPVVTGIINLCPLKPGPIWQFVKPFSLFLNSAIFWPSRRCNCASIGFIQ